MTLFNNIIHIKERLFLIESLHNAPPTRNTMQEALSNRNQVDIPDFTVSREEEALKLQNHQKEKEASNSSSEPRGRPR